MQARFNEWGGRNVAAASDLQRGSKAASVADLGVTAASLVMAHLATPVAWFWVLLSQMAFDGCLVVAMDCLRRAS